MKPPLRWGIIGCGDVCEVKSGPALQKAEGSRLVSVCRRNGSLARDFAERHGVPRWTADPQAVIDDPEVDIVYIATPPGSHRDYATRTAAAGKPCYVEKPMARSAAECDAMTRAFDEADQPLFVAYYRRALPRFVEIKRLLDAEALGTITAVSLRHTHSAPARSESWRIDPAVSGGGLFLDVGSHALDLLDFLFGPLTDVQGHAQRLAPSMPDAPPVEDRVAASFALPNRAPGTALWDFAATTREEGIEIRGTRGTARVAVFSHCQLETQIDGQTTTTDYPDPPHVHQPLVQTLIDQLLHPGQSPPCPSTGESAARTSQVMDRLLETYYAGRNDDFWNHPQRWGNPVITPS
ncbi:MAG: Gfo/Idh/MocA family oxidoreductase [Planctomycetota bacterium]